MRSNPPIVGPSRTVPFQSTPHSCNITVLQFYKYAFILLMSDSSINLSDCVFTHLRILSNSWVDSCLINDIYNYKYCRIVYPLT